MRGGLLTGWGAPLLLCSSLTCFFCSLKPASVTPRAQLGPAAANLEASASVSPMWLGAAVTGAQREAMVLGIKVVTVSNKKQRRKHAWSQSWCFKGKKIHVVNLKWETIETLTTLFRLSMQIKCTDIFFCRTSSIHRAVTMCRALLGSMRSNKNMVHASGSWKSVSNRW